MNTTRKLCRHKKGGGLHTYMINDDETYSIVHSVVIDGYVDASGGISKEKFLDTFEIVDESAASESSIKRKLNVNVLRITVLLEAWRSEIKLYCDNGDTMVIEKPSDETFDYEDYLIGIGIDLEAMPIMLTDWREEK